MNIYSIPLYYISFKKNDKVEEHYKKNGFRDINHFEAVIGKKMDPKKLIENRVISVRAYDDLLSGRSEHSGMPSLGAIGCAMSHYGLWNTCIDRNLPFIIITEEDNRMLRKLTEKDINNITKILSKPKSIFISVRIKKEDHRRHFFGTHFYIASLEACKELIKDFFPIDVQVDWYIANKSTLGNVNLEGYPVSEQTTPMGKSSIQAMCVRCILPKTLWFYVAVIGLFIIVVLSVYIYRGKWKNCVKSCSVG